MLPGHEEKSALRLLNPRTASFVMLNTRRVNQQRGVVGIESQRNTIIIERTFSGWLTNSISAKTIILLSISPSSPPSWHLTRGLKVVDSPGFVFGEGMKYIH
jgi:hypothetical protein